MRFTVMITTRNRRDDLCRTLRRLRALNPAPEEVIVCADGCTDDTVALVRAEFSQVTLLVNETGQGSVASRDRILRAAQGEWVLSLDDDSYPIADDFLARVKGVLQAHPEAAVVTFPELNDGAADAAVTRGPAARGHYVSAYPNCAALMRREFYLNQPGFPSFFFHMYEETDYTLQCYAAGRAVWFEPSLTIRHHVSPVERSLERRHHQNARNELWSVWLRCPWPWLPLVSAWRVWRQLNYSCSEGIGWAVRQPVWWWAALRGWRLCRRARRPIPWPRYLAWMRLARRPILTSAELWRVFPPLESQ